MENKNARHWQLAIRSLRLGYITLASARRWMLEAMVNGSVKASPSRGQSLSR